MGKTIWVNAAITFDCNKSCEFCYVDNRQIRGPMSQKVLDELLQKYEEHVEKYGFSEHNIIVAVGGEPLLYEEIVKEYFTKIKEITPDVKFRDIFTNGLLLTEDFVKWTKNERIVITLSCDDTSSGIVEDRMKLISKHRRYAVHSIALSYENMYRLNELIDLSFKYKLQPRLRHIYTGCLDQNYIETYDKIVTESMQRILDKGYLFYPHFLYEMTGPFWDRPYFAHPCGSQYFVVDPDGKVRVCPAKQDSIGSIFDDNFEFIRNIKCSNFPSFKPDGIEECQSCEFKVLCGGGCLVTKIFKYGTHLKPSPFCKTFKKVFPMVIEMKNRWIDNGRRVSF
jgi:radical SAM protein with 4Fe4S-binding SPASM domain